LAEIDRLLTLREVAYILRISLTTAKIWASKRRFPVVKVGRLVRVAPGALDEWVRENTHQTPPRVSNPLSRGLKGPKTGSFEGLLDELRLGEVERGRK
jgi:excisionase family DNA binding protein